MSYLRFPVFDVDVETCDKLETIVLGAGAVPFTPADVQEKALALVIAFREAACEARYHAKWGQTRVAMSRAEYVRYVTTCEALTAKAKDRARLLHHQCQEFVIEHAT